MWRKPRPVSIFSRRRLVSDLLRKHRLRVPESTIAMLTNTVTSCRRGRRAPSTPTETRKRLSIALEQATALLEYTKNPPSRAETLGNRVDKLRGELSGFDAIVWLEVPMPRVRSVLATSERAKPSTPTN